MRPEAPDHDPCFDCECCALWLQSLEVLKDAIRRHDAGLHVTTGLVPDCMICNRPTWSLPRGNVG